MDLGELTNYLDDLLRTSEIPDYPRAHNGLQVECRSPVSKVALAVDASLATIDEATRLKANLLIVHHGLFWGDFAPLTGRSYRRLEALIRADLGVYASHLPLDVHPELGNNAVLARAVGIDVQGTFGKYEGLPIGVWGRLGIRREALAARLDEILGCRIRMVAGGPEQLARVGVISGAGATQLGEARGIGLDALITGEGSHHHYFDAVEGEINLYLGGHYATEVWGVRALADHLRDRFPLDCIFVDQPTGL